MGNLILEAKGGGAMVKVHLNFFSLLDEQYNRQAGDGKVAQGKRWWGELQTWSSTSTLPRLVAGCEKGGRVSDA